MDKLKKIISPGHSKDDEVMYGNPNVGTPAGDSSHHTGTSHSSHTAGNDTGLSTQSTGLPGSTSTVPGHSNVSGAETSRHNTSAIPSHLSNPADDAASTASIRSGVVGAEQPSGAHHTAPHTSGLTGATGTTSGHDQQGLVDRTLHQHAGPGHTFEHGQGPETPVPGYVHHVKGPHATDIANRLDPHVPGEFPTSPNEDSSFGSTRQGTTGLTGSTGAPLGDRQQESSIGQTGTHHQTGAGLATGAGVGALGGAAALGSHERSHHEAPGARTAGFEEQRFDPSSRSHQTSEPHSTGYPSTTSHVPGATTTSEQSQHGNLGRDAAIGGAGVGALGAYEATHHGGSREHESISRAGPTTEDPASHTTGRHESNLKNILDPRELPQPEKMKGSTTSGQHVSDSRTDKDHHYGRDAALAGGAGAAGVGAYEATHGTGHTGTSRDTTNPFGGNNPPQFKLGTTEPESRSSTHTTTDPSRSDKDHHYGRDAALAGGAGAAGVGAYEATRGNGATGTGRETASHLGREQPAQSNLGTSEHGSRSSAVPHQSAAHGTTDHTRSDKEHHHGRDAALAGGAGAAGVGAYEATRGTGHTGTSRDTTNPFGGNNPPQFKLGTTEPEGTSSHHQGGALGSTDHTKTDKEHHYGRDAALVGGAGAVGAGAYGATRSDGPGAQQPHATPTGAPQDARIFDQTQQVPDSQQVGGGWAADTKAQEKLQKERAKEAEKAEKAHHKDEKALHKDEKAHEKALKEAEKDRRHSTDKGEKEKKSGGILGFLHRDKSEPKDTPEERELKQSGNLREADQVAHLRHQRELEAAAAAGTVGVAGASFEPPLREQLQHSDASSPQTYGTESTGHNKLHKDPPAKVQRELDERAREQSALGGASSTTTGHTSNIGNTGNTSTIGNTSTSGTAGAKDGIVTEPHTGLPMNVGKYGSGTGGTDGSSNIPGYHGHQN